ncbi:YaiO family outer membrane beta-barrel protein [Daejeonella sp.]|uniref:YaiO family outer membrane beta-barrel protein n=1 Tax=Daejeonella sp. TaxID=2805397 RepID=UPI00398385D0
MIKYLHLILLILLFPILCSVTASAQDTQYNSDQLFEQGRNEAFEKKNYPRAIALAKLALVKSPDYADIRIFLGRLYTWSNKPDSARAEFSRVITENPNYEDVYLAYGSLEFWEKHPGTALPLANKGLEINPRSEDLLLLKARILRDLNEVKEANETLNELLVINPKNTIARNLSIQDGGFGSRNKVGISYDYVSFNKQFDQPWHLASIDYGRQTAIGSITGRLNYANRFQTNATQFELDLYPRISKVFYAYMNAAVSNDSGVFPKFRTGFSLYANLPAAFEAEAGFRMLDFGDQTWIYTASIGKYYKNYWFNLRTFLTPSNSSVSQSLALSVRYYFGGVDDYLSFGAGSGLSPDNQRNTLLYNNGNTYKLKSNNLSVGLRKSFNTSNIIGLRASYENQEYLKDTRGNQVELGVAFMKRF